MMSDTDDATTEQFIKHTDYMALVIKCAIRELVQVMAATSNNTNSSGIGPRIHDKPHVRPLWIPSTFR